MVLQLLQRLKRYYLPKWVMPTIKKQLVSYFQQRLNNINKLEKINGSFRIWMLDFLDFERPKKLY